MELFNTKVAKFWNRFDQFLELLYWFGVADIPDVEALVLGPAEKAPTASELNTKSKAARIGLTFYAKKNFLQLSCDFMLGKKSPLCRPDENRPDIGNYSVQPDFNHLVNLITLLIDDADIQKAFPPTETDKQMLQHPHLLKSVLSSPSATSFANLLAEMCRDDYKLSKKVAKVFLVAIEGSHDSSVSNFIVSMKPFLMLNDQYKQMRLEWVFGVPDHRSQKSQDINAPPQYGIEMTKEINEDHMIYESPIKFPESQTALAQQLIKLKGKMDSQCVAILKELSDMMA